MRRSRAATAWSEPSLTRKGRKGRKTAMSDLIRIFSDRGDLAHLALFLWASAASAGLLFALRELSAASRRFDDFVRELQRFNRTAHRRAENIKEDLD
ncbi:hypothetical protein Nwi_1162 [Nitrobacter winogradskyi Nb-255]|uniref:Uncharacterized protein n=3 Tax=Nitrobacter winogradskyi TaxID=913 RepID=Q3STG7_NITWN|nr:hypothetical protein Nwi_1162 [Nitrobacter winogradskyi Nb-255]